MTLKIAICDDNAKIAHKVENIILEQRQLFSVGLETSIFLSGESICRALSDGSVFDIVFMDIEMYEINGIEAAKYIRYDLKDRITQIVFITHHDHYVYDAFNVFALDFIRLSGGLDRQSIIRILDLAVGLCLEKGDVYYFDFNGQTTRLPHKRILYFESRLATIFIHTTDGKVYRYYGKISNLEEELGSSSFCRIHQSYIVNLSHVDGINSKKMFVAGKELSISDRYKTSSNIAFDEYVELRQLGRAM
jgi:DNA-binding LytR/AlgR family response regulator